MTRDVKILIIGAGVAGLSAAHELLQRGEADFALLEAHEAGGLLRTESVNGFLLEAGPDSFLTAKGETAALAAELGLATELLPSNDADRRTWILAHGALRELPSGWQMLGPTRLAPVLRSALFSAPTRRRFVRDAAWGSRPAPSGDLSVAAFVRHYYGREVGDVLVGPLLAGVYGGDLEQLSLAAVLPRFSALGRSHSLFHALRRLPAPRSSAVFTTLRGGMGSLITALLARVGDRLHGGEPAQGMARHPNGFTVTSPGGTWTAKHVILALPACAGAILVRTLDADLSELLQRIPYASSAVVSLAYMQTPELPAGFGFLVARGERMAGAVVRMLACTFVHRKFAGRVPAGKGLLRVFYGGTLDPTVLEESDAALIARARTELHHVVNLSAEPCLTRVARWPRSMPQYTVGHLERRRAIAAAVARHPGLHLAGNAYDGIGISDAVRSGRLAARAVTGE